MHPSPSSLLATTCSTAIARWRCGALAASPSPCARQRRPSAAHALLVRLLSSPRARPPSPPCNPVRGTDGRVTHLEGHPPVVVSAGRRCGRIGAVHPDRTALDTAVTALRSPDLAAVVAVVAWPDPDAGRDATGRPRAVLVADHAGVARLDDEHPDGALLEGRHPLPSTDPMAFLPYELEVADPSPDHARNAYPLPWPRLASFFTDPPQPRPRGRAHRRALLPRAGRARRRARVARRDPVARAVAALRCRRTPTRARRRPRAARRRDADAGVAGGRRARRPRAPRRRGARRPRRAGRDARDRAAVGRRAPRLAARPGGARRAAERRAACSSAAARWPAARWRSSRA